MLRRIDSAWYLLFTVICRLVVAETDALAADCMELNSEIELAEFNLAVTSAGFNVWLATKSLSLAHAVLSDVIAELISEIELF